MRLSDPLLLEDVLERHQHLRIFAMHAKYPRLESMNALLSPGPLRSRVPTEVLEEVKVELETLFINPRLMRLLTLVGGGGYNGIQWLLANHRDAIKAQYVLNADAGGGELCDDQPIAMDVEAAEKVFHSVSLTTHNPGGHSSLPRPDNAIYDLAAALGRVAAYAFPFETNAVTRAYFSRTAALVPPWPPTCGR